MEFEHLKKPHKFWLRCTQKERVARWENVLRVLQKLTPHERRRHWEMNTFGEKTECGTVACAAGHCGLDPWFRRRGFKLEFTSHNFDGEKFYEGTIIRAADFFGAEGADDIFHNATKRSVSKVIQEVKSHIKRLKTSEYDGVSF